MIYAGFSFFLWLGAGGRPCSNFLASTESGPQNGALARVSKSPGVRSCLGGARVGSAELPGYMPDHAHSVEQEGPRRPYEPWSKLFIGALYREYMGSLFSAC